ncbi:heme o synthase [Catenovulum sediminis]|uniref:Protoheme IX farnesyltransferase n=1 Tax=Catenovulum sediminis TaxID=1740262 RepID=A0ABV1RLM5_9ALTE|nr:heme o synthase [Catenovulum sediminis]
MRSKTAHKFSLQIEQLPAWRDFFEITKPKVVALILLTALVGMLVAQPNLPSLQILLFSFCGIALLSGSAAAVNHVVDAKIDSVMARTHNRPLAKGRLTDKQALAFAAIIGAFGFVLLWYGVNQLTAWLTLASLVGYAVVYTLFLKRATPQNIVIGGLAGAMPPLLGWTSVTNQIDPNALLLVLIIFTWTPPHFWALAIHREKDYRKAGVPMLPVTHGIELTKTMVLLYTILLTIVCILPWLSGLFSELYLAAVCLLNLRFMHYAVQLKWFAKEGLAFKTFKFSIWHLLWLFVFMMLDHFLL